MDNNKKLTVKTQIQKLLFDQELLGQISDGMWENARPHNHYKSWFCSVVVGDQVGRNFYAEKDNYNFLNREMLEIIGERMVIMVRVKKAIPELSDEICCMLGDTSIEELKELCITGHSTCWKSQLQEILAVTTEIEVERARNDETLYTIKELRKDLKELRIAIKTTL